MDQIPNVLENTRTGKKNIQGHPSALEKLRSKNYLVSRNIKKIRINRYKSAPVFNYEQDFPTVNPIL